MEKLFIGKDRLQPKERDCTSASDDNTDISMELY